LGNCVKGPNVQVNDKLFENVAPEDAEKFVEKISEMDKNGELDPKSAFDKPQGVSDFNSPAYKG
jgi:(2Fe-2S) ferredoxin